MEITGYTVEKLHDPTGIIEGSRYEFFLEINVPEEDELFSDNGIILRVLFAEQNGKYFIPHYEFIEKISNTILDFALEEEEEKNVYKFCVEHYTNA